MPIVSKAQSRWAFANKDKSGPEGDAAREYIAATPPGAIKRLPERVGKKKAKPRPAESPRVFGALG